MAEADSSPGALRLLRQRYQTSLHQLANSPKLFEVLDSVSAPQATLRRPATLYVLDSSFNPPTRAHLRIATSAFLANHRNDLSAVRLLLLLATQNADKPSKPASFEDRLVMMKQFARDVVDAIDADISAVSGSGGESDDRAMLAVDIGVTKLPYFTDKAVAISSSGTYPAELEQVHLTGYDTMIRIFDPKYYPPKFTLEPLSPFITQHRLRVTLRPDDGWGGQSEQRKFLENLAGGEMETIGAKREWVDRIQIVEGRKEGEEAVSSTKARQEAKSGNADALGALLTDRVKDWVVGEGLYRE